MMDLAQQPFTLAGSLWSWQWVYKHWLLRPSGPVSETVFFEEERAKWENVDIWDIYQNPKKHTKMYTAWPKKVKPPGFN